MNAQMVLIETLQQHPELSYSEAPGYVRIEPPTSSGFAVELRGDGQEWTVFLGDAGLHETFTSTQEVLDFIGWCYSGAARVREVWRGGSPLKATLEPYENGEWHPVSHTHFIFVPFWRERREVVLENPNRLKG